MCFSMDKHPKRPRDPNQQSKSIRRHIGDATASAGERSIGRAGMGLDIGMIGEGKPASRYRAALWSLAGMSPDKDWTAQGGTAVRTRQSPITSARSQLFAGRVPPSFR